jgi:leucyl-tRNA synthetase
MKIRKQIKYVPSEIELKWQAKWEKKGTYQPDLDTANSGDVFYNLMMFPYPSAEGLHVGGIYTFSGIDVYGRFQRMMGRRVFEPIGLDGFGIHSENHAIKTSTHPIAHAERTEKNFYRQLHSIGNSYAWKNKLETYDPEYYRWTQWLFVQLFKSDLAYKKNSPVNFCPSCKTVLSDEQVIDGACERCVSVVEKRDLEQWFFRITHYAEQLLANIEKLDWSAKVKLAQKNWIGKKEGINITYVIEDFHETVTIFTTRPDTNFGATFIALAPEHDLVKNIVKGELRVTNYEKRVEEIKKYLAEVKNKSEIERTSEGKEKTGVFTGLYAVNPLTGYKMPVWVSDFVLGGFGTGALVGVPGHDMRDFDFAKKFGLEIVRVVVGKDGDTSEITKAEQVQETSGTMINSGFLNGMDIHKATEAMMDYIEEQGYGKREVTYHLRDWLISRQRYWGPPIPMIYCEACAKEGASLFNSKKSSEKDFKNSDLAKFGKKKVLRMNISVADGFDDVKLSNKNVDTKGIEPSRSVFVELSPKPGVPTSSLSYKKENLLVNANQTMSGWFPVPDEELPVKLPYVEDFKPLGTGKSPLANYPEFYETTCPNCGGKATRETDVSDTFFDSAWYFLRYLATDWKDQPFPSVKYAQEQLVKAKSKKEIGNWKLKIENSAKRSVWLPVTSYIGGAEHSVLHLLYARFMTMALKDMGYLDFDEPFARFYAHGLIIKDGAKMSKSKGNVINPDEYIQKYGADTLRTYLLFLGPFDQGGDFRDSGIEGMHRFVKRVWKLLTAETVKKENALSEERLRMMHVTIKGVSDDLSLLRFNTAIAKLMTYYNFLAKQDGLFDEEVLVYLQLFAPFAPHLTEELYQDMRGGKGKFTSIHTSHFPVADEKYLQQDNVTIAVQVNGKLRGIVVVTTGDGGKRDLVERLAKEHEGVVRFLEGKEVEHVVFVAGKIMNFVVG